MMTSPTLAAVVFIKYANIFPKPWWSDFILVNFLKYLGPLASHIMVIEPDLLENTSFIVLCDCSNPWITTIIPFHSLKKLAFSEINYKFEGNIYILLHIY